MPIEIKGLRELNTGLRAMNNKGMRADLRKTNKKASEMVRDEAKGNARVLSTRPGTTSQAPGQLRDSIKATSGYLQAKVRVDAIKNPHVFVQEFGWPAHNIEPSHAVWGAWYDKRAEVLRAYERWMDDLLDRYIP